MSLLLGGVDVQFPHLTSVDTQGVGAPCYFWVGVGVLTPYSASTHTSLKECFITAPPVASTAITGLGRLPC